MTASVTYRCRACGRALERGLDRDPAPCQHCRAPQEFHPQAIEDGALRRCPACGLKVLYRQKDFRQAVGCVVVLVAAVLAPFTYYLSLVAAALIDAFLYWRARDVLICYRFDCRAQVRGVTAGSSIQPFELSIHDYYRSLARAGREGEDGSPPAAPMHH